MVPFLNILMVPWKTTDLQIWDLYVTSVFNTLKRKRVEKDFWGVCAIILVRCLEIKSIILQTDSKNEFLCSSQQKFSIFNTPRLEFPSTWGQLSPWKNFPQYAHVFSNLKLLNLGSYKLLNDDKRLPFLIHMFQHY
jgi:hypothetical protein